MDKSSLSAPCRAIEAQEIDHYHAHGWVKLLGAAVLSVVGCFLLTHRAAADEASDDRLQEVIVTARKRAENLQEVPVSAVVMSGRELQTQNVNSLDDLSQTLPDVHFVSTGNFASNDMFIRGVGSGQNPGFDQSVGNFVDDVYFGRSRIVGDTFLDLDRIEVLKGPPTTFFGNSAIAGALNIITKQPGDIFDGWVRALYGMFGQYAVEGAPLVVQSRTT